MGARFFTWLSERESYRSAHAEAVALTPAGGGAWIDVGCGPGLVARLAARRGFSVRGFDRSPGMVRAARAQAAAEALSIRFEVAPVEEVATHAEPADVVSAASLLFVLPDRLGAMASLWDLVVPGGTLLVIETTPEMRACGTLARAQARGGQSVELMLWGLARGGRSAARDIAAFRPPDLEASSFHPLLGGLLGAWMLRRSTAAGAIPRSPCKPEELP
jgi:SAM-dependent methyltransferase